jgi:hypothetical protein
MTVHLVKLAVGAETVDDLALWQAGQIKAARARKEKPRPVCGARAWPKRADALLAGGSLYWVIKGVILVRQTIVEIGPVTDAYGERCGFYLDAALVRTVPQPRRAFQGWRYLEPAEAPADLAAGAAGAGELPDDVRRQLVELGAW